MMVLKLHYKLMILYFFVASALSAGNRDSIKIYVNDSVAFWHAIVWVEKDSINGKCIAVFENNKTQEAIIRSFVSGKANGVWKQFYPNGHLLEKIVYKEGLKNGEYILMNFLGEILIKGSYKNNLKHGLWDDRILNISGKYKEGKKVGLWKWKYDGFNYHIYQFENGELKGKYSVPPPEYLIKN